MIIRYLDWTLGVWVCFSCVPLLSMPTPPPPQTQAHEESPQGLGFMS